jgi:hypothetical protein
METGRMSPRDIDFHLPNEPNVMEVYFDESGYTGENLDDCDQKNLFLAAVAVPGDIGEEFWNRARGAWEIAGRFLDLPPEEVELKGADIYGGKGQFSDMDGSKRLDILDAVFTALTELKIRVYWDGLPKQQWKNYLRRKGGFPDQYPFWNRVLIAFCDTLYQVLSALNPEGRFHLCGDQNCWVDANNLLVMPNSDRWSQLAGGGIEFYRSSEAHGIQIADVVVHTLYRANRHHPSQPGIESPQMSNTDRKATEFHARLEANGLWVHASSSLDRIEELARGLLQ